MTSSSFRYETEPEKVPMTSVAAGLPQALTMGQ
jgi:hypothetical protein